MPWVGAVEERGREEDVVGQEREEGEGEREGRARWRREEERVEQG